MKKIIFLICVISFFWACQQDEINSSPDFKLEFSNDTIKFDTVFTQLGSVTKILKVYNRDKEAVVISKIYLGADTKNYRLNISGMPANAKENLKIEGKDSLYIFVEVTLDPNNQSNPLLIQDSIVFETNGNKQDVDVLAYGQDVHILKNGYLSINKITADKPWLCIDTIKVAKDQTLTIEAGAVLHFYRSSLLKVEGSLICNGTKEKPIILTGSRLEKMYDDVPGQWYGIWLVSESKAHKLEYTFVKNANVGIQCDLPDENNNDWMLQLINCKFEHHALTGMSSTGSKILAINSIFADCGFASVYISYGGFYEFYHCTIANFWNCGACQPRTTPGLILSNYIMDAEENVYPNNLQKASFSNCIIYGNQTEGEIGISGVEGTDLNFYFDNCLMKIDRKYDYSNPTNFNNNVVNPDEFTFKSDTAYNYELDTLSIAKDRGKPEIIQLYPPYLKYDLNAYDRSIDGFPDLGAYERKD